MKSVPVETDLTVVPFKVCRWLLGTQLALERYASTFEDREALHMTAAEIKYPPLNADAEVYRRADHACVRMGQKIMSYIVSGEQCDLIPTLDKSLYRYEHDCHVCVFLGQHEEFDMWLCPPDRDDIRQLSGSVIVRDGEQGAYASSPLCMTGRILERVQAGKMIRYGRPMMIAVARALRLGLVTPWHLRDGLTELSVTQIR